MKKRKHMIICVFFFMNSYSNIHLNMLKYSMSYNSMCNNKILMTVRQWYLLSSVIRNNITNKCFNDVNNINKITEI